MSRFLKLLVLVAVLLVAWKLLSRRSGTVEIPYEPPERPPA